MTEPFRGLIPGENKLSSQQPLMPVALHLELGPCGATPPCYVDSVAILQVLVGNHAVGIPWVGSPVILEGCIAQPASLSSLCAP